MKYKVKPYLKRKRYCRKAKTGNAQIYRAHGSQGVASPAKIGSLNIFDILAKANFLRRSAK